MARRSATCPTPTAASWNIFSATRSNCAVPPLGYNSRQASIPTRIPEDAASSLPRSLALHVPAGHRSTAGAEPKDAETRVRSSPMSNKGQMLQDPFLNILRKEHVQVSIYLVNGIKLQGQIESFDQYVVLLKNTVTQMVYKHAISTVVPARAVVMPHHAPSEEQSV